MGKLESRNFFPMRKVIPFLFVLQVFFSIPALAQWVAAPAGLKARFEGQSILYNRKIYVFTGFKAGIDIESTNEVFNPATGTWSYLANFPLSVLETNPTQAGVTHNGCVLVGDSIWFIGGRTGDNPGPETSEVWIYDIAANTFYPGPSLPLGLAGGGAVAVGRTIHVVGGFTIACGGDQDVYHLTLDIDNWRNNGETWLNERSPMPRKRNHFSIAHLKGKIYLFGGQTGHDCGGGQDVAYNDVYDVASDSWSTIPDMPSTRSHMEPSTFVMDGLIYVGGGEPGATVANKVAIFNPANNTWTQPAALDYPNPLIGPSFKAIGTTLYLSHGGLNGYQNPSNLAYTQTIARNPVYQLGYTTDTLKLEAFVNQIKPTKTLLWAVDGKASYTISQAGKPAWLTFLGGSASGSVTSAGAYIKLQANANGLTPGTYYFTLNTTGSGPSELNPAVNVNHSAAQLVVKFEVKPSPDGVLNATIGGEDCDGLLIGGSVVKTVTLSTFGAVPINFSSITLSNTTDFTILTNPLPASIPASGSTVIQVRFSPTQAGPLSTNFTVNHNGTNSPLTVNIACEGSPDCSLPVLWTSQDIGAVGIAGSVCYESTPGRFTVRGSGNDIWSTNDQFRFVYLPVTGDGEIIARVNSIENTNNGAMAALMIRESTATNSRYVSVGGTVANGIRMQRRENPGNATNFKGPANQAMPQWLRLVRTGNTFVSYRSTTSASGPWTLIGDYTAPVAANALAGLALTSKNNLQLTTAVFTDVSVNFAGILPVVLTSFDAALVGNSVYLDWTTSTEINTSHFAIERSVDGAVFETIGNVAASGNSYEPRTYGAVDSRPLFGKNYYRLKMVDIDGSFEYSPIVEVYQTPVTPFVTYPNPTSDLFRMRLEHPRGGAVQVRFTDMMGRTIQAMTWDATPGSELEVPVADWAAGIYTWQLVFEKQTYSGTLRVHP